MGGTEAAKMGSKQYINLEFVDNHMPKRAYGKAGNGNETETGNGNWKRKLETEMGTKDAPITGAIFSS